MAMLAGAVFFSACSDDDSPAPENEEEIITDITLTFTPADGGVAVVATAQDPDGEGPQDIEIADDIVLVVNTDYKLTIKLENSVARESITEEVEEEGGEHMFFFAWTDDLFAEPSGDGNIDSRAGVVNYVDADDNGLPVGLITSWKTGSAANGTFRLVLKHQPGIKSATSTAEDGESDVDLTWNVEIREK